jgi:hypothetical protein
MKNLTSKELHDCMVGNKIVRSSSMHRNKWHRTYLNYDHSIVRNTYNKTNLIGVTAGIWEIIEVDNSGYLRIYYSNINKMDNSMVVTRSDPVTIGPFQTVCKNDICIKLIFHIPTSKTMDQLSIYYKE